MNDCDKCRYEEVCHSLGEADLSCEDVERIETDFYIRGKETIKDGEGN